MDDKLKLLQSIFNNQYDDFDEYPVGGVSDFFIGRNVKTNDEIILKIIKPTENNRKPINEINISKIFNHKNIVKIYDGGNFYINGMEIYFLIEKLYKYDVASINEELSNDVFSVMRQILEGVFEIHSNSVIHRDLKLDNFLVDDNKNIVISDFGNATYLEDSFSSRLQIGKGTYAYMAPECWADDNNNFGIDIYALGICFYELLTKHLPFFSPSGNSYSWKIQQSTCYLPKINSVSNSMNSLLIDMTAKKWKDRPTIKEVIDRFCGIIT